jgi:hypothetical protein
MSGRGFIEAEAPQQCDECGGVAKLRPYGPGGAMVCYSCLTSWPECQEVAHACLAAYLFGEPLPERYRVIK